MNKCPCCGGTLTVVEELYFDNYVCNRCGATYTEDELRLDEGEDEAFDSSI